MLNGLQLHRLILTYVDSSGSMNNMPKRGDIIDTEWGILKIRDVESMTRYLDGGATPFTIQLTCEKTTEKNYKKDT